MFYQFIALVFISLLSCVQASNRILNQDTFANANWRLEVKATTPTSLHICLQEGNETLIDQTVNLDEYRSYRTRTCTLTPDGEGFQLSYIGSDGTNLKAHIDAKANITVLPNRSGIINTGFSRCKSWGFKTPGSWNNAEDTWIGFYNLITEAKEFHNFGTLQIATGHFTQDYHFNRGVFHLGVTQTQICVNAYNPYAEWLQSQASSRFQKGIIENYGVILAEKGLAVRRLSFNNYGYSQLQFLDLDEAPLVVNEEPLSGVQNLQAESIVHITEGLTGRTPRIQVGRLGFLSVSSVGPNLFVQEWVNQGTIQTLKDSEFVSQQTWNNQGYISSQGNVTIRNRARPQSLGTVLSSGAIKSLIEEVLSGPEAEQVFKTGQFLSPQQQVTIDVIHHLDHYLNTTTDHYDVDQRGNRRYTHQTQTGYQFQRRETTRTQKVIPAPAIPLEAQQAQNTMKNQHLAREAMLDRLKEAMKKIDRLGGEQSGLLGVLLQGLRDAGLSASEIQSLIDDAEIGNALIGLSMLDSFSSRDRQDFLASKTDSGLALNHFYTQAQRAGLGALDWVKRNGAEFVGHFCDLANLANRVGLRHPAVVGVSTACNLGRFSPETISAFKKAEPFFSKRHDDKGGTQLRTPSGSGSSATPQRIVTSHPKLPEIIPQGAWQPTRQALDKIPEFLGKGRVTDKGEGVKWSDGTKGNNVIRINQGDPKADYPSQRVPYVKLVRNGQVIGRDGKPILRSPTIHKSSKHPDAHIPLSEWIKWTTEWTK